MASDLSLNRGEALTAAALGAVFFLRMLGLFMLVPVLALYVERLDGATPLLIGLALGVYGLTQAACQIPLGALSDRIGRRPVICAGLTIFTLGAAIAAIGHHVLFVIAGRAVQGAGAVSGATLALAADLTREEQRTKVMAIIGISIGGAFSLAFVVGPAIDAAVGLRGLFVVSGCLAVAAMAILFLGVPRPPAPSKAGNTVENAWQALAVPELRILYLSVFLLHLVLAGSFIAIPIALTEGAGIASNRHATVYLPVLLASFILVGPLIMVSSRRRAAKAAFYGAIVALGVAEMMLWIGWNRPAGLYLALIVFFTGFNFLEASLPGIISRVAPASSKGAALGAFATFQFLGMFAGGVGGGLIADTLGFAQVPLGCVLVCGAWFVAARSVADDVLQARAKD